MLLLHALLGKSAGPLIALAYSIIQADEITLGQLGAQFFALRSLRLDQLIYPDDPQGFLHAAACTIQAHRKYRKA